MMKEFGTSYEGSDDHEEDYYFWMMDALDGELTDRNQMALDAHLRACPRCMREWQALLAVEALLRQAPMLRPAADFAQRTLALLPDRHYRRWILGAVYGLVLLGGLLPLLLVIWVAGWLAPILSQPDLLQTILASIARTIRVFGTVIEAFLTGVGRLVIDQPGLVGWLLVMAGLIVVWGSIYQRIILSPERG
jgi:hypothetical protein